LHAFGCTNEAFALRIFAEADKHLAHQFLEGG
jgi:hypothetical protein